jgi:hypothetical protein
MQQHINYPIALFVLIFSSLANAQITWNTGATITANVTDEDIILNGVIHVADGLTIHSMNQDINITLMSSSQIRNNPGANATLHVIADSGRTITFIQNDGQSMIWRAEGNAFTFTISEEGAGTIIKSSQS